ncbi:hypothetical protein Tco_1130294 [Tanacetum coccineum]
MTTPITTTIVNSQMHNDIIAAGSKDCPQTLTMGRYALWQSRFGKFTLRDGESIETYYSRFYKMMNEMVRNKLEVATMQIAKTANPLALVAATQHYPDTYYQAQKSQRSYAPPVKTSSLNIYYATTRNKGKEIAKLLTPPSESTSEEDSNLEQAQRDKDMQNNLALIAKYFKKIYKPTNNNLRTSSNTKNKNVDTSPRRRNEIQTRQFRNQRRVTIAGASETIGNQKAEKGVPLCAEQTDWLDDTDEELDEQELEAHYYYMAKIQEVDSNVIPHLLDMYDNDNQADQNAEECDDERVVLANLIANLKLDTDENKMIQKQLKKQTHHSLMN